MNDKKTSVSFSMRPSTIEKLEIFITQYRPTYSKQSVIEELILAGMQQIIDLEHPRHNVEMLGGAS